MEASVPPTVPKQMRALRVEQWGGDLCLAQVPTPEPKPRQVLIAVHRAAINPRDWMIRAGRYPFKAMLPALPLILGSDVAGVVAALGSKVSRFQVGDRVLAMQPSSDGFGAYAEYVAIRESAVVAVPETLDLDQGAGLPLAGLTALQAVRDRARFQPGQDLLVVGAMGGVGHLAVQIGRILGARRIVGVCSTANQQAALELGCDRVVDYRSEDFRHTAPAVDVIFDTVGRHRLGKVSGALKRRGIYVTTVPSATALRDSIRTRLRPWGQQSRLVLVAARQPDLEWLGRHLADRRLKVLVDQRQPMERARLLHEHSRGLHSRGKNILQIL